MTYTVRYKTNKNFFWKKIKNIKGDGILENGTHRWFITNKEERIEIPLEGTTFWFDEKRYIAIKENLDRERNRG